MGHLLHGAVLIAVGVLVGVLGTIGLARYRGNVRRQALARAMGFESVADALEAYDCRQPLGSHGRFERVAKALARKLVRSHDVRIVSRARGPGTIDVTVYVTWWRDRVNDPAAWELLLAGLREQAPIVVDLQVSRRVTLLPWPRREVGHA